MSGAPRPGLATAALIGVTAVWGSTFVLIKDVVARMPVADFLAVRFAVAAAVMLLLLGRHLRGLDGAAWRRGLALGAVYGVAQVLQTEGLARTSASVSGFVTGMYVVLTPVLGALLLRHRTPAATWVAVVLATAGLGALTLQPGSLAVGPGELLVLASAAVYALHILGLSAWSSTRDALGLSVVQMLAIAVVCTVAASPGGLTPPPDAAAWGGVLYTAVAAGALALVLQTWAQAHLPATRAAVVMTMEPVFAAAFAVALGGERLGPRVLLGGALVLVAMLLAELRPAPPPAGAPAGGAPPGDVAPGAPEAALAPPARSQDGVTGSRAAPTAGAAPPPAR